MPERSLSVEHEPWALRSEDRLDGDHLRALVCHVDGPCVSLFMPTHRGGPQIRQDPIRLKNLLRAAEQTLNDQGHRSSDVRSWLSPISALEQDKEFWRYQSGGLAVFVAPSFVDVFRLALRFDEFVIVTDRFHVSPLLPHFTENGQFYVLSLSQNGCRLLRCTRNTVDRLNLPDAPSSMTETPGYERRETQLQFEALAPRGSSGTSSGGGTALFHGHGSSSDASTADLERYFRAVDRAVCEELHDRREPLLLAGVDYLVPLYRDLSHYKSIASESLTGNHEELADEELRRDAWPIMEVRLRQNREETLDQVKEAMATGRGSDRLADVVPAAVQGKVDVLVAPVDRQAWGRFDPDRQQAEVHDQRQPGDEDLYELAVVQTLLHRGQVFPAGENGTLAARFRY